MFNTLQVGVILLLAVTSTALPLSYDPFDNSDPISANAIQIDVSFGSAPQEFKVMLDTNIAGMWIPHVDCQKNANGPTCSHKHLYNPKKSSTVKQNPNDFHLSYRGDTFSANNTTDFFYYFPENGLNVKGWVNFGLTTKLPSVYYNIFADGVFGLGNYYPEGLQSPIVQWIKNAGPSLPIVNIYYLNNEDSSTISIAKEDNDHCEKSNEFQRVNVFEHRNWAFPVKVIFLGLKQTFVNYNTTIDFTSDYIFVPRRAYEVLKRSGNITEDPVTKHLIAPCDDDLRMFVQPHLTRGIYIETQYLTEKMENGKCVYKVKQSQKPLQNEWKLGLPFLRQTCTTLDYRGWIEFPPIKL